VSEDLSVLAPFAGTVVAVWHARDDPVSAGEALVVLEAMKMEHEVLAEVDGTVRRVDVAVGDIVEQGQRLAGADAGSSAGSRRRGKRGWYGPVQGTRRP
jgi:biotin carboxyl carrier protein